MNDKLNSIVLIDDDKSINFLHNFVIKQHGCVEKVVTFQNGRDALNFFEKGENDNRNFEKPAILFLDINMPQMNGWEFLEEYKYLDSEKKSEVLIIMLTASLNPDDEEKSRLIKEVDGFRSKPLTNEMLDDIVKEYFENKSNKIK